MTRYENTLDVLKFQGSAASKASMDRSPLLYYVCCIVVNFCLDRLCFIPLNRSKLRITNIPRLVNYLPMYILEWILVIPGEIFFFFEQVFGTEAQIMRYGKKIICKKFEIDRTMRRRGLISFENLRILRSQLKILLYVVKLKRINR